MDRSDPWDGVPNQPDPQRRAAREACAKFLLDYPLNEHDLDALDMEIFKARHEQTLNLF